MLERQTNKLKYALLAVRAGGPGYFISAIKERTYRKETFIGLARYLEEPDTELRCKIDYTLRLASPADIEEMVRLLPGEGKEAIFDILQRKWFFESGFRNCYVARTAGANELCYMQWTISRKDENAQSEGFISSFPRLSQSDMQLEHAYTFKKFRGNKIMPAVMNQLFQIARERGFKRVITYVLKENIASLKGCYNVGFRDFEIVHRTKLPFSTRYEITPPIKDLK